MTALYERVAKPKPCAPTSRSGAGSSASSASIPARPCVQLKDRESSSRIRRSWPRSRPRRPGSRRRAPATCPSHGARSSAEPSELERLAGTRSVRAASSRWSARAERARPGSRSRRCRGGATSMPVEPGSSSWPVSAEAPREWPPPLPGRSNLGPRAPRHPATGVDDGAHPRHLQARAARSSSSSTTAARRRGGGGARPGPARAPVPRLPCVATSREPLGVPGEVLIPVAGMTPPVARRALRRPGPCGAAGLSPRRVRRGGRRHHLPPA